MSTHRPRRIAECASCHEIRPHQRRGLCGRCVARHRDAGTLDQFPTTHKPRAQRLEDWRFLKAQGYTLPQAAERLGLTVKGLEKVIERARRDGIAA